MSNTTVTEAICDLCGAEIRDGSLFCYNCGTAVRATPPEETVSVAMPHEPSSKTRDERPPLRSAASLRKERRAFNRQPIEVKWEPKAETSIGFIIVTVFLAVAALMLLLIAMYLR